LACQGIELFIRYLVEAVNVGRLPDLADAKNAVARNFPMGRWCQTDDIAGVILFLASDNSRFMTGAELTVDGAVPGFQLRARVHINRGILRGHAVDRDAVKFESSAFNVKDIAF
jgi:peroxiredoxin